jgi:hypothetical protein
MEEVVKQLKTAKECLEFIKKQKKLIDETRQWSLDLRVNGCGCSMDIERELWQQFMLRCRIFFVILQLYGITKLNQERS